MAPQAKASRERGWRSVKPLRVGDHTIERASATASRVTLGIEFTGFAGALVGRLFANLTRSYIATEAAELKALAERDT